MIEYSNILIDISNLINIEQITKEELKEMPIGTKYYYYNPLTGKIKEEILDKNSIVFSKYCYDKLEFYLEVKNEQ